MRGPIFNAIGLILRISLMSLSLFATASSHQSLKNTYLSVMLSQIDENLLDVQWHFNNSHVIYKTGNISSFTVSYEISSNMSYKENLQCELFKQKNERNFTNHKINFHSSKIARNVRSISLYLPLSCDVTVCVTANQEVGQAFNQCSYWVVRLPGNKKDQSEKDSFNVKKLIAGLVAGCLFLIPCALLLLLIYRKDVQMRNEAIIYEGLGREHLNPGFVDETMEKKKQLSMPIIVEVPCDDIKGGKVQAEDNNNHDNLKDNLSKKETKGLCSIETHFERPVIEDKVSIQIETNNEQEEKEEEIQTAKL